MRAWTRLCLGLSTALVLSVAAFADEQVERFLPAETFFYVGVEKLGPAADRVLLLMQAAAPTRKAEFSVDRIVTDLSRGLQLEGVQGRETFLAATGIDPDAGAGVAGVLPDPSFPVWRSSGEPSILVILPVKDRGKAERVAMERVLPELRRTAPEICRHAVQRIEEARRRWAARQVETPAAAPTWEDLAQAWPGFRRPVCPGGGEYTLGKANEPTTCTLHKDGLPREAAALPAAGRQAGDVKLVGGRAAGVGYAITDSHILFSNDPNVLEAAVAAAADPALRARLGAAQPPSAAPQSALRGFLNVGFAAGWAQKELLRTADSRRRVPPGAVERLGQLMTSAGGLTANARLDQLFALALDLDVQRTPASAAILDIAPGKSSALELVPDTVAFALGTNLSRFALGALGDIAHIGEPRLAALVKLTMAAADGDGAFAVTRGQTERGMPNMLFVLRMRDRETTQSAVDSWLGAMLRDSGAAGADAAPAARVAEGDPEVWRIPGRDQQVFGYAYAGPFVVAGTRFDDVQAAVALYTGKSKQSLLASEAVQRVAPAGPANVLAVLSIRNLVDFIANADYEREVRAQNWSCRNNLSQMFYFLSEQRGKAGWQPPKTLEELIAAVAAARRGRPLPYCAMFGRDAALTYNAATGEVTCPRHGAFPTFQQVPIQMTRVSSDTEKFFSSLGAAALRIWVEGDHLKAEGRVRTAP